MQYLCDKFLCATKNKMELKVLKFFTYPDGQWTMGKCVRNLQEIYIFYNEIHTAKLEFSWGLHHAEWCRSDTGRLTYKSC